MLSEGKAWWITANSDSHQVYADKILDTRSFVRPQWMERLALLAMRAAGGHIVPFEVPNPTPCCADH